MCCSTITAGASSVSAHVLAPSSSGLFHRAILQSGSVFTISTRTPPEDVGKKFVVNLGEFVRLLALCIPGHGERSHFTKVCRRLLTLRGSLVKHTLLEWYLCQRVGTRLISCTCHLVPVGCDDSIPSESLSCIRSRTVDDILGAQLALGEHIVDLTMVFDDAFLAKDLRKVYSQSNYSKVDYLSGVTSNEGFILGSVLIPEMTSESIAYWRCKQQLRHFLSGFYSRNLDDITEEVIQFYIGKQIDSKGDNPAGYDFVRKRLVEIVGELLVQAPTFLAAQLHAGMCVRKLVELMMGVVDARPILAFETFTF